MKQYLHTALKLIGERILFNFISLIMIPIFIPFIDTFFWGAAMFSAMVRSLYLGISLDTVWKVGRHDQKRYATEKHYKLKGLVLGAIAEIPFFISYILLLIFPGMFPFYRVFCVGTYMGFLPQDHVNIFYGLVLLIMPIVTMLSYRAGYKPPKEETQKLSHKLIYKTKKQEDK